MNEVSYIYVLNIYKCLHTHTGASVSIYVKKCVADDKNSDGRSERALVGATGDRCSAADCEYMHISTCL